MKLSSPRRRVWIVDAFAGPGRYRDGQSGSPEIAMQVAEKVRAQGPDGRLVQCVFGERGRKSVSRLHEVNSRHRSLSNLIIEDDFWDRISDVRQLVGNDPVLIFIDPFGLLGVNYSKLCELINGLGQKVDLVVNFRSPAVYRLATNYRERLDAAVGSPDWSVQTIAETFKRNLERDCAFLPPASLSVKERLGGTVRSELILASRSPDAYELWNDQMILESERMGASSAADRDSGLAEVADRLAQWASTRGSWLRQAAIDWYVVSNCGDAHTGTIKRAIDALVRDGRLARTAGGKGIESDLFKLVQKSLF